MWGAGEQKYCVEKRNAKRAVRIGRSHATCTVLHRSIGSQVIQQQQTSSPSNMQSFFQPLPHSRSTSAAVNFSHATARSSSPTLLDLIQTGSTSHISRTSEPHLEIVESNLTLLFKVLTVVLTTYQDYYHFLLIPYKGIHFYTQPNVCNFYKHPESNIVLSQY